MSTFDGLTVQVVTKLMPLWQEHLANDDCECGWDLDYLNGPGVNRCNDFSTALGRATDDVVPTEVADLTAFLAEHSEAWEWASESTTIAEAAAQAIASELWGQVDLILDAAAGPLVPPDGQPCENEHPRPVPAVATWHLTESQSAANITFVCAACAVAAVKDALAEDAWDAFELRPLSEPKSP